MPAYNAQNTIRRCIDSILQQSYGDFEIIIVNDGSKDNTAIIVDEYQDNDKRIQFFIMKIMEFHIPEIMH